MSRPRLFKGRDDYARHLSVIDLGTDVIKVLVVRVDPEVATVLGVGRHSQAPGAMENGTPVDGERVRESCDRALEAAEDMAGVVPGRALIGIAGEQVRAFSSVITYPRERPDRKLQVSELWSTLQLVERRALLEGHQHMGGGGLDAPPGGRLVQSAILRVQIDGSATQSPIGQPGQTLEVTVFNTFAPVAQAAAIEALAGGLDLDLVGIAAQPYALARAAGGPQEWEAGAVFADFGGDSTEVALLRGVVEGTRAFNLGGRSFTSRLAQVLGCSLEDAEARKLRHSEGLEEAGSGEVGRSLAADVEVLLQGFNLCLQELAQGAPLPDRIYVCGGGSLLPELMAGLLGAGWREGLDFCAEPRVRRLAPTDVRGVADSTGLCATAQDVGPLALAGYAAGAGAPAAGGQLQRMMVDVLRAMKV